MNASTSADEQHLAETYRAQTFDSTIWIAGLECETRNLGILICFIVMYSRDDNGSQLYWSLHDPS